MPDQNEELLDEVTNVQVEGKNITLSRLFEPPRELTGYEIKYIDCMHNTVLLVPCAID
jgi:predicted RNA-binding protein